MLNRVSYSLDYLTWLQCVGGSCARLSILCSPGQGFPEQDPSLGVPEKIEIAREDHRLNTLELKSHPVCAEIILS